MPNKRFYLQSNGVPGVTPAFDSKWTNTGSALVSTCNTTKQSSAFASTTITVPRNAGRVFYLFGQFISDPLAAPISEPTMFWAGSVRASVSYAPGTAENYVVIRIMDGTGTVVKSRYYGVFPSNSAWYLPGTPTADAGGYNSAIAFGQIVGLPIPSALTALGVLDGWANANGGALVNIAEQAYGDVGDIIVIEIGVYYGGGGPSVTPPTMDIAMEFGDASANDQANSYNYPTDYPTAQRNPWMDLSLGIPSPFSGGAWLVINEPSIGQTDQTLRLDGSGDGGNFQLMLRQRGTAEIPLRVDAGDSYEPTLGTQVFLYDVAPTGSTLVYVGTIDNIELSWDGVAGFRRYVCTCVSLEQCLDAIEVPPQSFLNTAAGTIVTTLFNALMAGAPITLGTISAGTSIPSLVISDYPTLSSVIDQLATTCGFIWGVDPASQQLFFQLPSLSAAPFTLATAQIQWESMKWSQNRSDFRDRQINQISQDAFANSSELFTGTGSASTFTLREKPNQVISAWVTQNTQNSATCTFTGLPSNGDTATVSYPAGGSTYNWAALAPYTTGQIIIDPAGHVQKVTTGGTSGASQPTWNDSGSTTVDGSVIWTDQGISGGGNFADQVYTFVTTLDNTLWGQVLIGATAAQMASNFSKAINAHESDRGVLYSMPTWENSLLNAGTASGGTFTVRNKSAGAGYIAALSESAANFTWSAALTSGGTTTFGTEVLQVAVEGTSNTANLYYTPGSTSVKLASVPGGPSLPISSSWRLQVEYTRLGSDCIAVEDTTLVTTRAAIENGTGKYQKKLTNTGVTSAPTGLLQAQQALAAYSTLPVSFTFDTWVSGLTPGQYLAISVSDLPVGIAALINGNWLIQEVRGRLENAYPYMDPDGFPASVTGVGHYQYTVTVINTSVIGDYLEFWQGMSSGSGGSGSNVVIAGAFPAGSSGGGGTGTVTSVALSAPTQFSVGGSPVTTSGTLALSWVSQNANKILAGPTTGAAAAPTFRSLVAADISGLCVTSVAMTVPTGELAVSGSPITGAGTLAVTWATQVRNLVLASAVSGGLATPSFRSLVVADIPSIDLSGGTGNGVTGNLGTNHLAGGTGASSATFWRGDGVWAAPSTSGLLVATNNLSDLTNTASARANLGLGSAAQNNTSDFLSSGTGVSDSFNPTFVTFMQFVDGQLISYS